MKKKENEEKLLNDFEEETTNPEENLEENEFLFETTTTKDLDESLPPEEDASSVENAAEVSVSLEDTAEEASAAIEETPIVMEEPPAEETLLVEEEPAKDPEPSYGAPQPLFEDIIPASYTMNEKQKKALEEKEKKKAEEDKKHEALARKQAEKEAKKQEKKNKGKAKEVIVFEEDDEQLILAPENNKQEEKKSKKEEQPLVDAKEKKYSSYEKKLRKKYGLNRDILLSKNEVLPDFILAKGENVIRSYHCLSGEKGEGTVCLTNKRLLINTGERAEIAIENVAGIRFARYTKFSIAKFVFWLLFFGLGCLMIALPFFYTRINIPFITGAYWKSWFKYVFFPCGGVSVLISIPLFATMVRKNFYFYIHSQQIAPFVECKSASYAKREQKGKVYKYMVSKAGKESEKAARELGALLIEAKEGRYDS